MSRNRSAPARRRPNTVSRARGSVLPALLWLVAAAAPASALDLAEAERIAIERDAVLRQLASESEGMRQRGVAEGQLMDPKLRFGAVNVPVQRTE